VQQDERNELAQALARQNLADESRRVDEERGVMAREFLSLHGCVRRGCSAIRPPQPNGSAYEPHNIVFDNATVQAKIDAYAAGGCHYHSKDAVEARDPEGERGETMLLWPCCGERVDSEKDGCTQAPAHEFPAAGVPSLHKPSFIALQLAVAVFDSVAASQGSAEAQFRLGELHSTPPFDAFSRGPNPLFDIPTAVKFYRMAAQQQHVTALRRLGDLLKEGKGVERDEAEAVKCVRIAADKGDSYAQYSLGVLLEEGRGVERDEAEAIRLYKAAVAQDRDSSAKYRLGYIAAFGILQDGSQALDAAAVADMLQRLGVKCGADLAGKSDYNVIQSIAKLLKPAAAHAAFSFTGHHF